MSVRFYKDSQPGSTLRNQWVDVDAGQTIAGVIGGNDVRAWVNGREVSALFIKRAHLKDGVEVYVQPIPKAAAALAIGAAIAAGAGAAAGLTWAGVGLAALPVRLSTSTLI